MYRGRCKADRAQNPKSEIESRSLTVAFLPSVFLVYYLSKTMKKIIVFGTIAAVFIFAVLLLIGRTYFPTNIADTAPGHAEAALRTRRYRTDLKTFRTESEKIIPTLSSWGSNWRLAGSEETETAVLIKTEVPVVMFTDDLQIKAEKAPDGVIVNVHSNSRVGKSDFGENRRHVLQILEKLDAKFGKN